MKIIATADLHGNLPAIDECDLLILAGDICPVWDHRIPYQRTWLEMQFSWWLKKQPAKYKVGVWGNHDWIGDRGPPLLPDCPMLTDELVTIAGLRIYGMPWQKRFCDWCFNLDEPELNLKYAAIPPCDIIVSHGPAYGYGDRTSRELTGSMALLAKIDEIKPKLVVTGHIHCDPGVWTRGETTIVNATLLDDNYQVAHKPYVFEL